jgi:hypothetical protein
LTRRAPAARPATGPVIGNHFCDCRGRACPGHPDHSREVPQTSGWPAQTRRRRQSGVTQRADADMGCVPNGNFARRGHAGVAELVDARHSKCRSHKECRFGSDRPHQLTRHKGSSSALRVELTCWRAGPTRMTRTGQGGSRLQSHTGLWALRNPTYPPSAPLSLCHRRLQCVAYSRRTRSPATRLLHAGK